MEKFVSYSVTNDFTTTGKNSGEGNRSLLQFDCGKNQQKLCFRSISLVFAATLTFQSIVHYAKRLDAVCKKCRQFAPRSY